MVDNVDMSTSRGKGRANMDNVDMSTGLGKGRADMDNVGVSNGQGKGRAASKKGGGIMPVSQLDVGGDTIPASQLDVGRVREYIKKLSNQVEAHVQNDFSRWLSEQYATEKAPPPTMVEPAAARSSSAPVRDGGRRQNPSHMMDMT